MQKGFQLKGKIAHLGHEDYLKAGQYWYDSNKNVELILYINNAFYTLSRDCPFKDTSIEIILSHFGVSIK